MGRSSKLNAVDFFCGAGGMTYGLSQAGINVLAGIDIDISCKETYEINNPGSKFIHTDIHDLTVKDISRLIGLKRNDDSLIFIGCSPCQYWTKINTDRNKAHESRNLLIEFQRFVTYFNPGYIVIENVPGLYKKKNENVLSGFLKFLDDNSYIYAHDIINANHYGVPQNRKRYLLIGSRVTENINIPDKREDKSLVVKNFIGQHNGFEEVNDGYKDPTDFLHTVAKLYEKNKIRIRRTPRDGGTRLSWKDDDDLQINAYRGKDDIFKDVYGRMYWNRPAPTITTRFNSISNGRFGHPKEDRGISLREGATLQTFPNSYKFYGSSIAIIARQIGNAVPVNLASALGKYIIQIDNRKGDEDGIKIGSPV